MSLKLTRRGFLKASAVASGSALLLGASAGSALAEGEEQEQQNTDEIIKIPSACRQCYGRCPIIGWNKGGHIVEDEHGWHVEGGRLVKIEGNPDFFRRNPFVIDPETDLPMVERDEEGNPIPFFAEGTLCSRAFAITQEIYNPTRVRYPQMQVGEKGQGKWKRVSWDEAIKGACDGFREIGKKYGWYTIAHQYGTGRDSQQFQSLNRLWLELGSTSTFGVGNLCWLGSYFTSQRLYGDECQYTGWDGEHTKAILIWCRQERSRGYYDWLTMKRAQERGAKIILVDPRFTCTASKADLWLPIRPGSDMALVLYFINEIMHSEKCDTEFARYFTNAPFFIDEKVLDGKEYPNATGYQLRQNMIAGMEETGDPELYPVYDEISGKIVYWNGNSYEKDEAKKKNIFQYLDENGEIAGEWIVMGFGPDKGKMLKKIKPALTTPDGKGIKIGNRKYRTAWDILLEHVTPWTAERAAEFCELPVDKIKEAINIYLEASPHACFCRGQKVEFSINTSGISQAFTIMMSLAGNFDTEGGQNIGREPACGFEPSMFDVWPMKDGRMSEERLATARDIMNRSVCGGISCNPQEIFQANDKTGKLEKVMQNAGHQNVLGLQGGFGAALAKAMTDGVEPVTGADPWKIHGLFMQTSEPILSIERGDQIAEGLKGLDMYVNVDMYMTPSGELANYVLPAAHPNEVPRLEWAHSGHGYPTSHTTIIRQPLIEPLGEARDDMDINFAFGKELGVDMYWKDKWEFFDFQLQGPESLPEPLKMTYPKLQKYVYTTGPQMTDRFGMPKFQSGAMRRSGDFLPGFNTMFRGNKNGPVYRTPEIKVDTPAGPKVVAPAHPQSDNGKLELWSEDLFLYGNGALPMYIEPPVTKFSRPDLVEEYPYQLITGGRSHAFFHTEYRNSPWMREVHMFPQCQFNPETAAAHGIEQDDWVWIETPWGKIRQRADITNSIKPGTVHVEHDWWFPEREATDQLHGAFDSNCNILFSNDGPYDPAVGTDNYGGLCKIYKAEEGAPEGICMNAEDLKVFLPLDEEALANDTQDDGIIWPTLKKEGK